MTYQIITMQASETKVGKKLIRATLVQSGVGNSTEYPNITIWGDFPNFAALMPSSLVEGEIVVKQNGEFENKTLYAPKGSKPRSDTAKKEVSIAKAMDRKEAGIASSMDRKEQSIILAGVARDATILTAQELAQMTATGVSWTKEDAQIKWKEWQSWLKINHGDGTPF